MARFAGKIGIVAVAGLLASAASAQYDYAAERSARDAANAQATIIQEQQRREIAHRDTNIFANASRAYHNHDMKGDFLDAYPNSQLDSPDMDNQPEATSAEIEDGERQSAGRDPDSYPDNAESLPDKGGRVIDEHGQGEDQDHDDDHDHDSSDHDDGDTG